MNQPLGYSIGNKLEVIEAMDALQGNGCKDLMEVVYSIASIIISEVRNISLDEACNLSIANIKNGSAFNKFKEFVSSQNGDINDIRINSKEVTVFSNTSGYISEIDAEKIGKITLELGAGRISKEDTIDYDVGISLNKKVGDYVKEGDILATIYYIDKEIDINTFKECFKYSLEKTKVDTIYGMIKCKDM